MSKYLYQFNVGLPSEQSEKVELVKTKIENQDPSHVKD